MEKKPLKLLKNGRLADATLVYEESQHPFVQLFSAEFNTGKIEGSKVYYCMRKLHEILDSHDLKLLCNSFRCDVHPSRMALSMGHGIWSLKLVMGQPATELVNIFDETDRVDLIGTVEDQKRYYESWMQSVE